MPVINPKDIVSLSVHLFRYGPGQYAVIPPTVYRTLDIDKFEIQLINMGVAPVDNLYNTYWSPYYNELYNPDTKYMTLKVNLNASDINQFNFFDQAMIKNKNYRVNKIEYKPNDLSTVEFILIG